MPNDGLGKRRRRLVRDIEEERRSSDEPTTKGESSPKVPPAENSGTKGARIEKRQRTATKELPEKKVVPSVKEQLEEGVLRLSEVSGDETLYSHQEAIMVDVVDYLREIIKRKKKPSLDTESFHYARIVAAPRTGKTRIAAEIVRRTGVRIVYLVPALNLVEQAIKEFRDHLGTQINIAAYTGRDKKDVSGAHIIIGTYQKAQKQGEIGKDLPEEFHQAGIVFLDEGHTSTTEQRTEMLRKAFSPEAVKIALTGTPDYSEERLLERYYPVLIHELSIPEAYELNMYAPFQYSIIEMDRDASHVSSEGEDFNSEELGEIYTQIPVLELAYRLRKITQTMANTPALITCASVKQANLLQQYMEEKGILSELITGTIDKNHRKKILDKFDRGEVDTLITVKVLTQGWDSPRCKYLIDLAPTFSPVLAQQKYTRPLTKTDNKQIATIVTVVPKNLPVEPIFPGEVFSLEEDIVLPPGRIMSPDKEIQKPQNEEYQLPSIDNLTVRLVADLQDFHFMARKELVASPHTLRSILETGLRQFSRNAKEKKLMLIALLASRFNFNRTHFSHESFVGSGRVLLRRLGFKSTDEGYTQFLYAFFPEEAATIFLFKDQLQNYRFLSTNRLMRLLRQEESVNLRSTTSDLMTINRGLLSGDQKVRNNAAAAMEILSQGGNETHLYSNRAESLLDPEHPAEDLFVQHTLLPTVVNDLGERDMKYLRERVLLGKTLDETGKVLDVSRERVRQRVATLLSRMKHRLELMMKASSEIKSDQVESFQLKKTWSENFLFIGNFMLEAGRELHHIFNEQLPDHEVLFFHNEFSKTVKNVIMFMNEIGSLSLKIAELYEKENISDYYQELRDKLFTLQNLMSEMQKQEEILQIKVQSVIQQKNYPWVLALHVEMQKFFSQQKKIKNLFLQVWSRLYEARNL